MTALRAVVFDLDDTLYPERAYVESGFRAVARWVHDRHGLPIETTARELIALLDDGVRGEIFDRWVDSQGTSRDDVPAMVNIYRSHTPEIAPYPGVVELLDRLRTTFALGLLSDGSVSVQEAKLDALGLAPYFEAIVFSDALGGRAFWKPSTVPFERAAELLGVDAREAVYVGENSTKDFLGAKKAGMRTIRLREPAGFYTAIEPPSPEHAADFSARDLEEVERLLARLREEAHDEVG